MSVVVPLNEIPEESLRNLVSGFVLREGTDYGEQEVSLQAKVEQVLARLKSGEAVIVYSELEESFDIVSRDSLSLMEAQYRQDC
ncbi:YheU family protein [Planctobacterium marinum]|uniref:YheU family protein n=1 Tax=Planctobacterium marinum TaxID=1631968 RepID=UPI001E2AD97A|nr:YheU family protein [Planctobacterium marinum]MCC2606480.1 YheU family protein [Planctobacterium marinum]